MSTTIKAEDIPLRVQAAKALAKPADYKLDGVRGLWLRISAKGIASWSLVHRVKGDNNIRRTKLGRYPEIGAAKARTLANELLGKIDNGHDPRAELQAKIAEAAAEEARRAAAITVAQAVDRFLLARAHKRSIANMKHMLRRELVAEYGHKPLAELTRADVLAIHDMVAARGTPRHADHTLSNIRSMLSWAQKEIRIISENVASSFERKQQGDGVRTRRLSAAELRALWLCLDRDDAGMSWRMRSIFRLAMLLGQRASEISGMRRGELSPDKMIWSIPRERMKANRPHVLPLPPMARQIITEAMTRSERPILFAAKDGTQFTSSAVAHAMRKLQKHLRFKDANGEPNPIRIHDLRRTLATGLQHIGTPNDTVKLVLAHTPMNDVTLAVYAKSERFREVHAALTRWQATIMQIVKDGTDPFSFKADDALELERSILGDDLGSPPPSATSNVVPLRKLA